jgi:hypothetical protein
LAVECGGVWVDTAVLFGVAGLWGVCAQEASKKAVHAAAANADKRAMGAILELWIAGII